MTRDQAPGRAGGAGQGEGDCSAQMDGTLTRTTPGTGDIHPDLLVQCTLVLATWWELGQSHSIITEYSGYLPLVPHHHHTTIEGDPHLTYHNTYLLNTSTKYLMVDDDEQ